MQSNKYFKLAALCAALSASAFANAALVLAHNQNVTNNVIFGTGGQVNGGFTTNTAGGVEVGLRARERHDLVNNQPTNVFGSNGDGTFNQNAGEPPGFGGATQNRARWNFDWSINSGSVNVAAYTYRLGMDFDAGFGTNFQTFDLINSQPLFDHAFGNNTTAMSAGVEAVDATQYFGLKRDNNLVQNSWNMDFFESAAFPFDPTANGNYSIFLEAIRGDVVLARSEITVIVGTGATVPEPGTLALAGLALAGLGFARRRRA